MDKLEFLGMSLHTGLKCNLMGEYTKETEYDDEPIGIVCTIEGLEIQSYIGTNIIEIQCTDDDYIHNVPLDEVFPILRPLGDLNKEITHKGETFNMVEKFGLVSNEKNLAFIISKIKNEYMSFKEMKILIELHFDIYDLISVKEAIDINSLNENPYE